MITTSSDTPGRNSPESSRISGSSGIDSITSVRRIRAWSTQPPWNPAGAPTSMPRLVETSALAMPTASEMRPPCSSRVSRSRPSSSVPSQCLASGRPGCPIRPRSCASNRYGDNIGPSRTSAATTPRKQRPKQAGRCASRAASMRRIGDRPTASDAYREAASAGVEPFGFNRTWPSGTGFGDRSPRRRDRPAGWSAPGPASPASSAPSGQGSRAPPCSR